MFEVSDKHIKHLGNLGAFILFIAAAMIFWMLAGFVIEETGNYSFRLMLPTIGMALFGAYMISIKSMLENQKGKPKDLT